MSSSDKYVFLACPWAPMGGGMFKVMDYLMQAQHRIAGAPTLRVLDSRGGGHVALSFLVLFSAMGKLIAGRLSGRLAGLHVNMAERMSVLRKGTLVVLAHWLGVPVVLHLHAAQMDQFYAARPAFVQALIRYVFALPAVVVVLGQRAHGFVTGTLQVPAARVEILINGVPGPQQAPTPRAAGGVPHLVFLGNLMERKGVSDLLAALATPAMAARAWRATLAGGGDVAGYRAKAAALGLDERVQFAGWMDQRQAGALVAGADLLILPSYDEGLPLVILEALGQGVAVLCTPVGEIPQVLAHRDTAYFVAPGRVDELAAGLAELVDDAPLRERLAQAGRRLYERSFSIEVFFNNLMTIYRRHFDARLFGAAAVKQPGVGS